MPEPDRGETRRQRIIVTAMLIQIAIATTQLTIEALRLCGAPC